MSRAADIGVVAGGLMRLPVPAPGLVRIRAVDNPALGVVAELDGPVQPEGYGTWGQVDRPKKLPLTEYTGLDPLSLPIPLLLDRWSERASVEPEIKAIETMLGRHGAEQPSVVTIEGPGIPFGFERDQSLRFVLGGLSWGDDIRTVGSGGDRSYVQLTLTATQFTAADVVVTRDSKVRKFYKVTSSRPYTLRSIGKKFGQSPAQMKALNRKRKGIPADSDLRIKAGVKVRVN